MTRLPPYHLAAAALLILLCLTQHSPLTVNARQQPTPELALPASDLVVLTDYKRISGEALPRVMAGESELRGMVERAFDDVKASTGLDLRALNRVATGVLYSDATAGTARPRYTWVSVARGIDYEKWLAFARNKKPGALREARYGGKAIHTLQLTEEEWRTFEVVTLTPPRGGELAFAALGADTTIFGMPERVRSAIDAAVGDGPRVRPDLLAAASGNPGALVSAAGVMPPGLTSAVGAVGEQKGERNELVKALASVKRFTAAVELTAGGLALTVAGGVDGDAQAKLLADVLTAIKTLTALAPAKNPREKASVSLFKGLEISAAGAEVRVRSELTDAALRSWARWGASDLYVGQGEERAKKGELDAAIAAYDKALAFDSENVSAYIERGGARSAKGEIDAALADGEKAIALAPNYATAYNNRGADRFKKGDYEGAVADFGKAISLDPTLAAAYDNRARLLAAQGRLEEALTDYDKAIALDSKNAVPYASRGYVRYQLADPSRAVADFDKALALDPKLGEAYTGRGYARTGLGEYDTAVADFDKALALDPSSVHAYNGRGLARLHKGEYDAAAADFGKAAALDPATAATSYANRGWARIGKDDLTAANADFERAIAADPKLAAGYYGRGYARYVEGEFAAAVADLDKAIAAEPDHAEAYGYRGLARLALGKDAEAARDLKKCFELDASLRPRFEELAEEIIASRGKPRRPH